MHGVTRSEGKSQAHCRNEVLGRAACRSKGQYDAARMRCRLYSRRDQRIQVACGVRCRAVRRCFSQRDASALVPVSPPQAAARTALLAALLMAVPTALLTTVLTAPLTTDIGGQEGAPPRTLRSAPRATGEPATHRSLPPRQTRESRLFVRRGFHERSGSDRHHAACEAASSFLWLARAFSSAWSMLKLAGFCRGGNSSNVLRNSPTIACAGTSRNARSAIHLS